MRSPHCRCRTDVLKVSRFRHKGLKRHKSGPAETRVDNPNSRNETEEQKTDEGKTEDGRQRQTSISQNAPGEPGGGRAHLESLSNQMFMFLGHVDSWRTGNLQDKHPNENMEIFIINEVRP